jgi:putative ABC transport system substrate-binding protein
MSLTEPVAVGLVPSLARPGGNVTGLTYGVDTEIFGKQLQLLKEVIPNVRSVAVLTNPGGSPAQPLVMESVKSAARSLGLPLQILEVREPGEFDAAFATMVKERSGALLLSGDALFFVHRHRLADLALKNGLPSMSTQSQWVEAGGLMSYAPSFPDLWRRAATYVDRIFRGARPADLPIEQPTKFELVVSMKTARTLERQSRNRSWRVRMRSFVNTAKSCYDRPLLTESNGRGTRLRPWHQRGRQLASTLASQLAPTLLDGGPNGLGRCYRCSTDDPC